MIRSVRVIFCDQEHGTGDVTFPALTDLTTEHFVQPFNAKQARAEAKKSGWSHVAGLDYCETCTESEKEARG